MYKIALDFDNVIYDLNTIIIGVLSRHKLSQEEVLKVLSTWDMSAAPKEALTEINEVFKNYVCMCNDEHIIQKAKEWIDKYKSEFDLYIITSRHPCLAIHTKFFIEFILEFPSHKVEVVSDKTAILESLKIDFLIDDGPHNIIPLINHATITPILVRTEQTVYNHELAKDLEKINKKLVINNLGDLTYDVLKSIKEVSDGKKAIRRNGFTCFRILDVFWNFVKRSIF